MFPNLVLAPLDLDISYVYNFASVLEIDVDCGSE